ncbi:MAG: hypothetical protein ACOVP7_05980 [Lacibacter sp.]
MGIAVYNEVPMIFNDGRDEHRFTVKLSPATESFRLESGMIKRSIFIGKRMFNKLFQFVRNEYGHNLGQIKYDDEQMINGSATTEQHDQFRFHIEEGDGIEVVLENEAVPDRKLRASIKPVYSTETERKAHLQAMMPSVLAAVILVREASPVL